MNPEESMESMNPEESIVSIVPVGGVGGVVMNVTIPCCLGCRKSSQVSRFFNSNFGTESGTMSPKKHQGAAQGGWIPWGLGRYFREI